MDDGGAVVGWAGAGSLPRLVAGRYRLSEVLGRGGMGVVWRASDELIGRLVAVKELRVPSGLSEAERSLFSERALREARTAGRLNHPGVIAIHDLVPATAQDDAVYIVMELAEAPSLAELLERYGALGDERVTGMAVQLLSALKAAHSMGLMHRDIKPSNIMVLPGDEVKIVDFGIAHAMDDTRLTRHGVAGSTGYMAPELFEGSDPSPATDLWALGGTLFHAVEGHDPFARQNTAATLHAILHEDLPPLSSRPPLSTVITGLLTRDTTDRMTIEQADALLRSPAAPAPAPSPARPARQTPATWQDDTTTVRPTGVPARSSPAAASRSGTDAWAEHTTTVTQGTEEFRTDFLPRKREARKQRAVNLGILMIGALVGVFFLGKIGTAIVTAPVFFFHLCLELIYRPGVECLVEVSPRGLTFGYRKARWSVTWGQLRHITLEPASGRKAPPFLGVDAASDLERYVVWHLRVELNSALTPKDNPFGVFTTAPGKIVRLAPSTTAVNALSFPTQELARTELSRLDAALRSYASRIYEPHDDLAALLNP